MIRCVSVVTALDVGPEGRDFEQAKQLLCGQPDKMLEGNLPWTSIPSRGNRNTPSRLIL